MKEKNIRLHCKLPINNKNGFFMLEALLYLALFGFCMTLFMNALITVSNSIRSVGNQTYHCMELTSALDLFGRDVWSAQREGIIPIDDCNVIIQTPKLAYGWQWDKDTLYRIQGVYNVGEKAWKKHKRNKVVGDIERFEYTFDEQTRCMQVVVAKDIIVQRAFTCKNGVV